MAESSTSPRVPEWRRQLVLPRLLVPFAISLCGLEGVSGNDVRQKENSIFHARSNGEQLRMGEPAGGTMRSVVEGMEELDDIVDVAFDEVCDGIVGNADAVEQEADL